MQEISRYVMQVGHVRHRQNKGVARLVLPLLERRDDEDVPERQATKSSSISPRPILQKAQSLTLETSEAASRWP